MTKIIDWKSSLYNGLMVLTCRNQAVKLSNFWHHKQVPPILTSGDHARVDRWRRDRSLERTFRMRPELLEKVQLSPQDRKALSEIRVQEN